MSKKTKVFTVRIPTEVWNRYRKIVDKLCKAPPLGSVKRYCDNDLVLYAIKEQTEAIEKLNQR